MREKEVVKLDLCLQHSYAVFFFKCPVLIMVDSARATFLVTVTKYTTKIKGERASVVGRRHGDRSSLIPDVNQEVTRGERQLSLGFLFPLPYTRCGTAVHGTVPPMFRLGPPSSVTPFGQCPHRHTQVCLLADSKSSPADGDY